MMYDQAKMIKAYSHLLRLTNDSDVRTAVIGSISFIAEKMTAQDGGFYSSQDAYLEDEYYGLTQNERAKLKPPYQDKTISMDSSSIMTITFLELYAETGIEEYRNIAIASLEFLENNMLGQEDSISEEGAYYYFDHEKENAFLRGQTVANSWALLTFVTAHDILKDEKYLKTAQELAEYSLKNLYDWNSTGFFERNSIDSEVYAPNEHIDLSRPVIENAVFSYALLKLYSKSNEAEYLDAGLKTLGFLIGRANNLEAIYYMIQTADLAIENNLLEEHSKRSEAISAKIQKKRDEFFLNQVISGDVSQVSLDDAPLLGNELAGAGFLVLAILAFAAGILSFLSPCILPVITAYFAHNFSTDKGEMVKNTIYFFIGLALVFSILGMGATLIGSILLENRLVFTKAAGLIIITFGILEIFGKGFSGLHIRFKGKHKTPIGSMMFGALFAIGWSACVGPILASLLLLSATSGTVIKGSSLLFIYAIGIALPLILITPYLGKIQKTKIWKNIIQKDLKFKLAKKRFSIHPVNLIAGLIILALGILIFTDYLFTLNQIALQTDFVKDILIQGELFLKKALLR